MWKVESHCCTGSAGSAPASMGRAARAEPRATAPHVAPRTVLWTAPRGERVPIASARGIPGRHAPPLARLTCSPNQVSAPSSAHIPRTGSTVAASHLIEARE